MNILFVCNQGMHRSKTAAELVKGHNTRYSGIYSEKGVVKSDLEWADLILVMEEHQRKSIAYAFPGIYLQKRILNLDVPDIYSYNQAALIDVLNAKINRAISSLDV